MSSRLGNALQHSPRLGGFHEMIPVDKLSTLKRDTYEKYQKELDRLHLEEGCDKFIIVGAHRWHTNRWITKCSKGHLSLKGYTEIIYWGSVGCRECGNRSSRGEEYFKELLDNCGIEYSREVSFEGLLGVNGKTPLRFDFKVCDTLIEIQGEQHYRPTTWGSNSDDEAVERFNNQVRNDLIKKEYCKDKGIELICVDFRNFTQKFKDTCTEIVNRFAVGA